MPGKDNRMSDSEKAKIRKWMAKTLPDCPACGKKGAVWRLGRYLGSIMVPGTSRYYFVILSECEACGVIQLLGDPAIALLGIYPDEE